MEVKPTQGQIDDLLEQIKQRVDLSQRCLVTTLTKRMAEELADYLSEMGIRNHYLHSDIRTLDRIEILRDLRLGVYDVIVGINLLREGLDLPEVSLVAILDADKEGYLRSDTSMVQTIGRAARHANGHVIMYADRVTDSMKRAIDETNRRRSLQDLHNRQNGIHPQSIQKEVHDITEGIKGISENRARYHVARQEMSRSDMYRVVKDLETQMKEAAKSLQFEKAAQFRDEIFELRRLLALEEKPWSRRQLRETRSRLRIRLPLWPRDCHSGPQPVTLFPHQPVELRQHLAVLLGGERVHGGQRVAGCAVHQAYLDHAVDQLGLVLHSGQQVFSCYARKRGHQAVASPVGNTADDQPVDSRHAGTVGQAFNRRNYVHQVAHADFIASIADPY